MQNIWIQCLALLQISNMTLGTSINLLHLSSFAAKWEESYYFLLAHSPAFSMETASIFWAVSWHNHVYKFSRGLEVNRCAKSQAQRGHHEKPKTAFGSTPWRPCRLPGSCASSALGLCFGPRDRSAPPAQDTRAQLSPAWGWQEQRCWASEQMARSCPAPWPLVTTHLWCTCETAPELLAEGFCSTPEITIILLNSIGDVVIFTR